MYENAQYCKDFMGNHTCIRVDINGVTSFVPLDLDNTDYRNIITLVEAGELVVAPAE